MAIARINGPMLNSNLERQGVNLAIDGNLMYYDVTNRMVGVRTTSPQYPLDISGNAHVGNLYIQGNTITTDSGYRLDLGSISNITIAGGSTNYVMYTDGAGTLSFVDANALPAISSILSNVTVLFSNSASQESEIIVINNTFTAVNAAIANVQANVSSTFGNTIQLGIPADLSLTANAAYDGWTTETKVTDAIDNLNQVALNLGQGTFVGNVQFTANVTANASPAIIRFTGTASGNPNTYYWDFGDGNTSTSGSAVTHTYANARGGLFTVYYRASNSSGTWGGVVASGAIGSVDDYTRTNYITLYTPNPVPSFTTNVASLNSGSTILFTDTSQYETGYTVYWGDGTTTVNATPYSSGSTQKHTYTNTTTDTAYSIILQSNSSTAGSTPVSVNSSPVTEKVYSIISPVITANGAVTTYRVVNWESNGGGTVGVTNSTTPTPGSAATFGAQQVYQFWWSDSTANSNVTIGSASSGDTGTTISHTYTITGAQQIAGTSVTYNTQLKTYTGYSTSPFNSSNIQIIVEPSVRSNLATTAITISNGSADNALSGYVYTDYLGNDRALFTFTSNLSQNATTANWAYGDATNSGTLTSGQAGFPLAANITHSYSTTGTKTVSLTTTGTPGTIAQSNTKTLSITIKSNPTAPGALSGKTLSMSTSSIGTTPYLAAGALDNTSGNIASAGTSVTRYTTSTAIITGVITNANTSIAGTLTAYINRSNVGGVGFATGTNTTGTYTNLVIGADQDYHSVDATYPQYFYKVFNASISNTLSAANLGYNDEHLSHTLTGSTNLTSYTVDNVTLVPTVVTSGVTMANVTATTIRTVSGIPYYQAGGNVVIQGLQVYNWIGQTFYGPSSASPMTVIGNTIQAEGTSGTITTSQTKTYAQLNTGTNYLTGGVPQANTGNVISNSYTFGNIYLNIDGTAAAVANANVTLQNVNGTSTAVTLPTYLNVYSSAYTGFDETSIVSNAVGNTTVAKRIVLTSANISTPTYANTGTNYYSDAAWSSTSTVAGTTEAIIRWGNLKVNTTNYSSGYLPVGPDLSVGGNRTTTQSFKFALQRPILQNIKVIFTGRVAGMYIAAPGTKLTDTASTLNGWLNANVAYAGSGYPGDNTGAGGNGSPGCAVGTAVPTSTFVSNVAYILTLGSAGTNQSSTNQLLFNLVLGPNDFVSNIYLGNYA